jgi:hypothetical protein
MIIWILDALPYRLSRTYHACVFADWEVEYPVWSYPQASVHEQECSWPVFTVCLALEAPMFILFL